MGKRCSLKDLEEILRYRENEFTNTLSKIEVRILLGFKRGEELGEDLRSA